jgi:hypothetical protein
MKLAINNTPSQWDEPRAAQNKSRTDQDNHIFE